MISYYDGYTSGTYSYDALGQKLSETVNYGYFSLSYNYEYYKNGLKKAFTGPDGVRVVYEYDGNNRLSAIEIPSVGRVTVNSYRWNSPAKITFPGGSQIDLTYDALMRLKSKTVKDATQNILMNYGYEYSPNSNITKKSTENGDYDYAYDKLHRLVSATNPVLDDDSYTYDLLGNRLSKNAIFDRNNALLYNDDASFEYDLNGNLVRKTIGSDVVDYVYDVADRLVGVKENGNLRAEYGYDPFGRRIWKEVDGIRTYFAYSDEGLVGEFDANGAEIKTYGWKPGSIWSTNPLFLKVSGSYFWYQNDHLGTPQKLVDVQGLVVWEAVYSTFGEARVDVELVESNLRFAGQYFDEETGLHYNLWRYYDPGVGRYLAVDPIWAVNLYGYANQNPLLFVDPNGAHPLIIYGAGLLLWIAAEIIIPSFQESPPAGSGEVVPSSLPDLIFIAVRTATAIGGGCKSLAKGFTGAGETYIDEVAEAAYQNIRNVHLDDIQAIHSNTGLSLQEAMTLKKHLFYGKHNLPQNATEWKLERFLADDEIAYAWQIAQRQKLTASQQSWFRQLANHELGERNLMTKGIPYRNPAAWNAKMGIFDSRPGGAHDLAPSQPGYSTFSGFEPKLDW